MICLWMQAWECCSYVSKCVWMGKYEDSRHCLKGAAWIQSVGKLLVSSKMKPIEGMPCLMGENASHFTSQIGWPAHSRWASHIQTISTTHWEHLTFCVCVSVHFSFCGLMSATRHVVFRFTHILLSVSLRLVLSNAGLTLQNMTAVVHMQTFGFHGSPSKESCF